MELENGYVKGMSDRIRFGMYRSIAFTYSERLWNFIFGEIRKPIEDIVRDGICFSTTKKRNREALEWN